MGHDNPNDDPPVVINGGSGGNVFVTGGGGNNGGGGSGGSCTTLACLTGSSGNVLTGGGGGCTTLACPGYIPSNGTLTQSLSGEYLTGNPAPDPALAGVTLELDTSPDGFISQAGNALNPNLGVTSAPILTPEFSQNLINSINSFQYYPVIGQYLSHNGIGIGDYLYNPVLPHLAAKTVVNGWMKFTNNKPVMAGPIVSMPVYLFRSHPRYDPNSSFRENLWLQYQEPQYY